MRVQLEKCTCTCLIALTPDIEQVSTEMVNIGHRGEFIAHLLREAQRVVDCFKSLLFVVLLTACSMIKVPSCFQMFAATASISALNPLQEKSLATYCQWWCTTWWNLRTLWTEVNFYWGKSFSEKEGFLFFSFLEHVASQISFLGFFSLEIRFKVEWLPRVVLVT